MTEETDWAINHNAGKNAGRTFCTCKITTGIHVTSYNRNTCPPAQSWSYAIGHSSAISHSSGSSATHEIVQIQLKSFSQGSAQTSEWTTNLIFDCGMVVWLQMGWFEHFRIFMNGYLLSCTTVQRVDRMLLKTFLWVETPLGGQRRMVIHGSGFLYNRGEQEIISECNTSRVASLHKPFFFSFFFAAKHHFSCVKKKNAYTYLLKYSNIKLNCLLKSY